MVENCQKLPNKVLLHLWDHILEFQIVIVALQGTPFRNQYSAFPFPKTHSKRGYISGLLRNVCTFSLVLDYVWKHCRYDQCSCQPNTAKVTGPAQIEDKVQVQVYSVVTGYPKTKSGPSAQFRTYSGPFLALWSGSGPSPEFQTFLVTLSKPSNATDNHQKPSITIENM